MFTLSLYDPRHEKTNMLVSDLVRHKPGCTATDDGLRLEISDLERRVTALFMWRKQTRLISFVVTVFVFACAKPLFSHDAVHILFN